MTVVKFDFRELEPTERQRMLDQLAEALATLETKDNIRFFLDRLLTESESVMLARRLAVAELLIHGRTYEQIQRKLKVGVSTIRGVDRWLTDAAHEYHLIREERRAAEREAEKQKKRRAQRKSVLDDPTFPGELRGLIRGDSRMILFRLLLGDF